MEQTEASEEPILPPSSAPIFTPSSGSPDRGASYIKNPGQVCYERVLPAESHYYKPPPAPVCTGRLLTVVAS